MSREIDIVQVFVGSPMDADIVKQLLEENGIPANLRNPLMGTIAPWEAVAGGTMPAEIEVFIKDEKEARLIIEAFNNSSFEQTEDEQDDE